MKEIIVESECSYKCIVGENAKENWKLLENATSTDILFHLADFPSCYVVLETSEDVSSVIIAQCARICLEHTKYRNVKGIYVDYTVVSNTKKGKAVGEVIYKNLRKVKQIRLK
jgi:predicted ribosome quality control (RQC) complex YloA/Tae2 family protein